MPSQKEVKKLNKDVVLAIDWAAAEYKYVKELQQDLGEIGKGKEPLKNLRKASKIMRYISRSERRTDRFEEQVRKSIEEISEELEKHLTVQFNLKDIVTALREIAKELGVEHAHLLKYSSFYDGLLEQELDKAAVEVALEEKIKKDNPQKAEQLHTAFLQLVHQIEYQIKDAEKWISALESSLKKAQQMLKELPDQDKMILQERGLAILHKYDWPFPDNDKTTIFLAQHPADLEEMVEVRFALFFFQYGLPAVKDLINEKTWPGMVKMAQAAGPNASYLFHGLPVVKNLTNEKTLPMIVDGLPKMAQAVGSMGADFFHEALPAVKDLINEKTWPGMVKMAQVAGPNAIYLFKSLPKVKDMMKDFNIEKNWLGIVRFVERNKDIFQHKLYSGQPPRFFRNTDGKFGIIREKFGKTGSETILLGGSLVGKAIIRIISDQAFQGWKKAFEAEMVWKGLGFDYVPIEPILTQGDKLRAYQTKEGLWRVSTRVLGPSLKDYSASYYKEYSQYKQELAVMKAKIERGLNILNIHHGHLHESNFCIEMHQGKIRLYAIDFDQAVS